MSEQSEPTLTAAIDAASLIPAEPATKGAASRFDQLAAEKGIKPNEEGITLRQQQEEAEPKVETPTEIKPDKVEKPAVEKPAKDAVPDFSKKPEKTETKAEPNYDEELKAHPAIKGEAAKSFKTVLSQRDEFKKQAEEKAAKLSEFETKLKELESRPQSKANDEKIAAAQKRIEELENEVGKANYTLTPKYKQSLAQEKQQIDTAKSYLDGDDGQQAAIETAANMPPGQKRLKVLVDAGMNAETISAVASNLTRIDEIRSNRSAELENWQQALESMEQESKTAQLQQDAKRKEFEETVFKTVLDRMTPKLEGLQKMDGYDDWNRSVDERMVKIKQLYNGEAELEEISEVVAKGVAYDAKEKLYANLEKKYTAAVEELSRLKAAANPRGEASKGDRTQQDGGTVESRFEATRAAIAGQ